MNLHNFLSKRLGLSAATAFGLALSIPTPVSAQQPFEPKPAPATSPAEPSFDYQLGRIVQEQAGGRKIYELRATQARNSRLVGQKVRLTIEETTGRDKFTRLISLRTGKYKTVAQFCAMWRDIFRKFVRETATGQELGKIGDLRYGGEMRFVAESPDALRYETRTPGEGDLVAKLTADDVANIVAILGGTAVPAAH